MTQNEKAEIRREVKGMLLAVKDVSLIARNGGYGCNFKLIYCVTGPFRGCRVLVDDERCSDLVSGRLIDPVVRPFLHRYVTNPSYRQGETVVLFPGDLAGSQEITLHETVESFERRRSTNSFWTA